MIIRDGIATALILSSFGLVASAQSHGETDMAQQLAYARENLERGAYGRVFAHTGLVLMDRPVRIYADIDSADYRQRGECQEALRQGMQMWRDALGDRVDFVTASCPDRADLRVRFLPDLRVRGRAVAGSISWRRIVQGSDADSEGILSAEVRIRTELPRGGPMGIGAMRHAMAHELGHVFGLSDRPSGVMGPVDPRRPVDHISKDEVDAILRLRREAADIRGEAEMRAMILP